MISSKKQKEWKKNNYEVNKKYFADRQRERRKQFRDIAQKLKAVPCADCKQTYPSFVMDFDHVRGEKEFEISDAQHGLPSIKRFLAEIAKCDIVCANCHRIRTHSRKEDKCITQCLVQP